MSEWQPIETAPKDGTLVLLTIGTHTGVGRWAVISRRDTLNDTDDDVAVFDYEFGWRSPNDKRINGKQPTHWMPLPQPPEDGK